MNSSFWFDKIFLFIFFQAEDGIRDGTVTGVQTCALPICAWLPIADRLDHPRKDTAMISRDSTPLLADLVGGSGLLTRIPVPLARAPRPDACWGWPVVGLAVAGIAAVAGAVAMGCGVPAGPAAALVLGVQALLTGGLHEDGLADTADGLFGGRDKERRLEIMKDSRIGSYGTLALLLVTLLRWSALAAVLSAGHWGAVLAAGAIRGGAGGGGRARPPQRARQRLVCDGGATVTGRSLCGGGAGRGAGLGVCGMGGSPDGAAGGGGGLGPWGLCQGQDRRADRRYSGSLATTGRGGGSVSSGKPVKCKTAARGAAVCPI